MPNGCIMQAAYRQAVGVSVPSPADSSTPDAPWWYDRVAAAVPELAAAGITAVLGPPPSKTASGAAPGGDGYGIQDVYDIGSKNQCGSIPTRFGSREQLMRLIGIMGFYAIQHYTDWIMHQVSGPPFTYPPHNTGRFPKQDSYFWRYLADGSVAPGFVARDNIAGPIDDDYAFANPFSYQNSTPKGAVMAEMKAAFQWLMRTLGVDGLRDDDVKGQSFATVNEFVGSLAKSFIVVGEYDDGNNQNVNYWVKGTDYRCMAWDFPLHYIIEGMCNNNSRWDMHQLVNGGFVSLSNANALTFVENPDTDTDGFGTVIFNKTQGYFLIMTLPGYPCIYWKDWATDDGCYGLKEWINNYVWIHYFFANGNLIWLQAEYQYVVYEREGNMICGVNNNQYDGWQTVTVQTSDAFPPNSHFHDVTGNNAMDCWSDENRFLTFGIPPNNNGRGVVAFVLASRATATIPVKNSYEKTLSLIGGPGLDIPNVMNGTNEIQFRIFGTPTKIVLTCDQTGWNATTKVTYDYVESVDGYSTFILTGVSLPSIGSPFELEVTFKAPKIIEAA